MRNFPAVASVARRQDRCPSCSSERLEYEFTVHGEHVLRCIDCAMLLLRMIPPIEPYNDKSFATRLQNRLAHLRANTSQPLRNLLVIVPDGAAHGVLDPAVVEASDVIDGRLPSLMYDGAICVDVLDRIDDPDLFLMCLHERLASNALLSITVRSVDSTAARHARAGWRGFTSGAARFYGVDSLQSTLIKNGFRDARTYVDGTLPPESLRIRAAAKVASLVKLGGFAVRAQSRAGFIDESVTIICHQGQPIVRYRLSVIVPVFNEVRTFAELMSRLLAKSIENVDIEVIVVESNSTDGSRDEVQRFESHPRVTIILQDRPQGKGNAVRAGLARATGDIILFQDADLEYEIEDYDDLIRPIMLYQRNFVIGSRHSAHGDAWKIRDFNGAPVLSQVFNFGHLLFLGLLNGIYDQSMADPFSMFKVFRRDCLAGLTFECNRFDFDFEIVIKLLRKGYRPLESPVNYQSRSLAEGKKVTMIRDPLTWLRALVRFRKSGLYADAMSNAKV